MMRRLVLAAALLSAVAGCAVGPDYVRPPVAAPDAYNAALRLLEEEARVQDGAVKFAQESRT